MTTGALDLLRYYVWPGNVRELKNLVERLAIMVEKEIIDIGDLPEPYNPAAGPDAVLSESELLAIDNLKEAKKVFEREYIQKKLEENKNNITRTAEILGVGRSYLHKKIKEIIR